MKALGQILLYLAATVLLGALLAPALYHIAHALAPRMHSAAFSALVAKTEFQRYFDRGILIAALALIWPLLRALQIRGFDHSMGLERDARGPARLMLGFFIALGLLLLMWAIFYFAGVCKLRSHVAYGRLAWQIPLTAGVVAVLEEFLFRGALQGAMRKTAVDEFSCVAVAILFAAVHFLKPPGSALAGAEVRWWSGLALLPDAFWMFHQPVLLLGGFTTLLVAGLILGHVRYRTRSLWMPIGLHAGWIVGEKGVMAIARHGIALPWLGPDIPNTLVGLGPLLALLVTWGVLFGLVRNVRN